MPARKTKLGPLKKNGQPRKPSPDAPIAPPGVVPLLLTMRDVRQQLGGLSRVSIYKLMAAKRLRSIKLGSRRLFPTDSVAKLVAHAR